VTTRTPATRRYTSTRRARQAAQTRADIVAAATALFESRGWRGTTIAGVAAAAGVAVDTIYAAFGSKSALLAAAKDAAKGGGEEETPLFDRPDYRRLGTGTRAARLRLAARLIAEVNERTRALDAVWREAAAGDPAIAAQLREREDGRRADLAYGLERALGTRPDETALDGLWAVTSPDTYAKLVDARQWTRDAYEGWLAVVLDRLTR
jgi:AcrR family transcriptional regulator